LFNYALHRKVPKNLQEEEAIFKQLPFAQKLQQDAIALAQTMVRHGLEKAEDAYDMRNGNVQYWDYIDQFKPKYKEKVLRRAEELAKQLKQNFYAHPEQFPMPAKQQGGAGAPPGGAPPAMASTDKPLITAIAKIMRDEKLYEDTKNDTKASPREVESFVLPDGHILVKTGLIYSIKFGNEKISFTAAKDEAIKVAMENIAAREML
jgi:hypothetical protein